MKQTSEVIGLKVFSVEEGRVLGRTAECVVDLAGGVVLGLIVDVDGESQMGILRADITAVGKDAVMVGSADVMKPLDELAVLAAHRTAGPTPPMVITRDGTELGTLGIVRVDETCERVLGYQIGVDVSDFYTIIADGPARLPIVDGTVHGRDAIVLPEEALTEINRPGGLRQQLEKAYDSVVGATKEVGQRVSTGYKKATQKSGGKLAAEDKADAPAPAKKAPAKKKPAAKKKAPAAKKTPAKKKATAKKRATKKAPKKAPKTQE